MILLRFKDEMKRAAYCAVQLIQNVSKNRANKKITLNDIKNVARAWNIVVPVSVKLLADSKIVGKGTRLSTSLILVKGTGNDQCEILWFVDAEQHDTKSIFSYQAETDKRIMRCASSLSYYYYKSVRIQTKYSSTSLYKDLHITNNKIKAVLEINLYNNAPNKENDIAKILGLRIL